MPKITAGWPFSPASPRLMAGANFTTATWFKSIGCWSLKATGKRARSSSRVLLLPPPAPPVPRLRIRYSREFSSRKPPLVLAEKPLRASVTCSSVTPRAAMRTLSGCTWYCRTSPPIGTTCAMPGRLKRRGRSMKSAYSRTCIASILLVSIGRASSMISPMMELIGPMPTCVTLFGSCSRAAASRSPTSWRAR